MSINIAINGFGRIGKCVLYQTLQNSKFNIVGLNAPSFKMENLKTYLNYDSVHKNTGHINMKHIDKSNVQLNDNTIKFFDERNAKNIDWKSCGADYLIETSGKYTTLEKAQEHNIGKMVICNPSSDIQIPQFVFSANHANYKNESIISGSSCTTNSITPILKILDSEFSIKNGSFTTIHATTASQTTADTYKLSRSVFNNIIPHKTGASKAIDQIIPNIKGKIKGTALRIPTNDVSLIDLNIELEKKTNLDDIFETINRKKDNNVAMLSTNKLVSSDFLTSTEPSIVDVSMSMDLSNNKFKLFIWYDNEWSYTAQILRLTNFMFDQNKIHNNIEKYMFHDRYTQNPHEI